MKVEFSAFPKAFAGNVAVLVGADKQLLASAKAIDASLGGALGRAIAASRFSGARNQTLAVLGQAGFARLLNRIAAAPLSHGPAGTFVALYLGTDLLVLGLGVYDLATRRSLHPAYLAGAALTLALQSLAIFLLFNPAWKAISLHLIAF